MLLAPLSNGRAERRFCISSSDDVTQRPKAGNRDINLIAFLEVYRGLLANADAGWYLKSRLYRIITTCHYAVLTWSSSCNDVPRLETAETYLHSLCQLNKRRGTYLMPMEQVSISVGISNISSDVFWRCRTCPFTRVSRMRLSQSISDSLMEIIALKSVK